ncbi:MAG: single-stranded DNA-binding protein, partial [Bacteroidales bacterium]
YDDRDGNKRYIVEVEADVIQLLGRRPDSQSQQGQAAQTNNGSYAPPSQPSSDQGGSVSEDLTTRDTADDLPF